MAAGVRFGCVPGGRRFRSERAVPSTAHGSQTWPRGWHTSSSQGVLCRRPTLWPIAARGAPSAPHPRYCIDGGRRYPRRYQVAEHQLANRHERESSKPALPLSACVQPTNLLSRSDSAIGAAVTHAAGFNNASEAPRFSTSPPKCRIDLPGKVE
jgi:hypothetical protein